MINEQDNDAIGVAIFFLMTGLIMGVFLGLAIAGYLGAIGS